MCVYAETGRDGWMEGEAECHPPDAQGQHRLMVTLSGQSVRHGDNNDERLFPDLSLASSSTPPLSSLCHPLQRAGALIHTLTMCPLLAWVKSHGQAKSRDPPNPTHVELCRSRKKTPKPFSILVHKYSESHQKKFKILWGFIDYFYFFKKT